MEREIRYTVKAVLRKRKNSKEKMRMSEKETKGAEYDFYGKLPLRKAIPLGLQHVLAMFVGNLTPLLIITGACGLANTQEFAGLHWFSSMPSARWAEKFQLSWEPAPALSAYLTASWV